MDLRTIYRFASDRTMRKLVVYLATVFLCCATFCLLLLSFFSYHYLRRERIACEHCLNGKIKQAGMIYFEDYWREEASQSFLQEMMQLEEIVGVTGSSAVYFPQLDTVKEIEGKGKSTHVGHEDTVQWLCLNPEGLNVCHFRIQEGKRPEEWELEEGDRLIYLGSDMDDFEVGVKYYDSVERRTYLVGGVLEKGTAWIDDDVYIFGSIIDSRYAQNLDNFVVEITDTLINGRNTYLIKNGYKLEEVEQTLKELAKKHGVDITLARLKDVLDENEANYASAFVLIKRTTMIIMTTVLILLLCTQFSEILSDSEYFGIFYANGASTKDLEAVLIGENVLKVFLSYLIAAIGGYFVIKHEWQEFQPGIDNWKSASSIYFGQTLLPTFLIGTLLIGMATVIPVLWLNQKKPMELIQGYKV